MLVYQRVNIFCQEAIFANLPLPRPRMWRSSAYHQSFAALPASALGQFRALDGKWGQFCFTRPRAVVNQLSPWVLVVSASLPNIVMTGSRGRMEKKHHTTWIHQPIRTMLAIVPVALLGLHSWWRWPSKVQTARWPRCACSGHQPLVNMSESLYP